MVRVLILQVLHNASTYMYFYTQYHWQTHLKLIFSPSLTSNCLYCLDFYAYIKCLCLVFCSFFNGIQNNWSAAHRKGHIFTTYSSLLWETQLYVFTCIFCFSCCFNVSYCLIFALLEIVAGLSLELWKKTCHILYVSSIVRKSCHLRRISTVGEGNCSRKRIGKLQKLPDSLMRLAVAKTCQILSQCLATAKLDRFSHEVR